MVKTILAPCPTCGKDHALVWHTRKHKRELGVLCDAQPVVRHIKGSVSVVEHVAFVPVKFEDGKRPPDADLLLIPEHMTPAAKQAAKLKQEYQFVLMNVEPGQQVERQIDLPRPQPVESAPSEPVVPGTRPDDQLKARDLQYKIEQCQQAQKELTADIEKLARKRIALENQERELRASLRVVFTEPLDLK